jgi:aspartyl protease family protein
MSLSSGHRSALADLAGWMFAGGMLTLGVVFQAELKAFGYWFAGVTPPDIASVTLSSPEPDAGRRTSGRSVELKMGRGGHFVTDAEANGRRIEVMVDTGATIVALTYEDARAAGLEPRPSEFTHRVQTANGIARVAPVTIDRLQIGDILVRQVAGVVIEEGKLKTTLLGNSFLNRLSRYEMRQGRLVLEE